MWSLRNEKIPWSLIRCASKRATLKIQNSTQREEKQTERNGTKRVSKIFMHSLRSEVDHDKNFTPAATKRSNFVHETRDARGLYRTPNVSRNVHEPHYRIKIQQKHSVPIFALCIFLTFILFSISFLFARFASRNLREKAFSSTISRWDRNYRCIAYRNFPLYENLLVEVSIIRNNERSMEFRVQNIGRVGY